MIKRIEVLDGDTGKTTLRLNLRTPFSIVAVAGTLLADDTTLTLGRVMSFADQVYDSLVWTPTVWTPTDGGYRATVIYGRFKIWIYTDIDPTTSTTQE